MVATWNPAANAGYYTRQIAYYTASGVEPAGLWYAPVGDHGLIHGSVVDAALFQQLFMGIGTDGRLLGLHGSSRLDRVPAFDVTLSAPRSVSLLWALGGPKAREAVEAAQAEAVHHTLTVLEREAAFARRGRNGGRIERVGLSAACFPHGESRPAEHADGKVFADPNLHTHCVILNLATRPDGSVGALHSTILRDWKMAAGATYHVALAAALNSAGFEIDRIDKNGTFEIAGVDEAAIRYFSARRQEIGDELAQAGVTSAEAVALAAAIAKATRSAKQRDGAPREETWKNAAQAIGFETESIVQTALHRSAEFNASAAEQLLGARLADLPRALTETKSVLDRREIVRAVAEALVGTGLSADRINTEVDRLIEGGHLIALGSDQLGLPRYSTPEMIEIERQIVEISARFAGSTGYAIARRDLAFDCERRGLSPEQTAAVMDVTDSSRLAIIEGAPGTGKTTLLAPAVKAWTAAGYRVIGAASAWRVANALRDDLGIEARATASWLARDDHGSSFMDGRTVLVVDEAGLLSSRDMHAVLAAAENAGAKVLLVGDRDQLQAIGAGSGLRLAAQAIETAKVRTIVRQHDEWARQAVADFGSGNAGVALEAFAERDVLIETNGAVATIGAVVDCVEADIVRREPGSALILAKTNAEVATIGREVRERLRGRDLIVGKDVEVAAITPSGHATELSLAAGDRIRFLARNDRLGVVNGSVATVTKIAAVDADLPDTRRRHAIIEARLGERQVRFDTAELADDRGRARIGWAYASTIYGAQGVTVDRAAVLLTPAFDRHDIYVASSRARLKTTLIVDRQRLEKEMLQAADRHDVEISAAERRNWLANRLTASHVKETTFDLRNALTRADRRELRPEQTLDEFSRNSFAPVRERGKEIGFDL